MDDSDSRWYKDAIIYQTHVKAYFDADDDGVGDFRGLTQKLEYIKSLGVTAIWLLPFYPSPLRDDGYDIAEYKDVNPRFGNLRDFRQFVRTAHDLGLRIITELVINHTSDQHAWFQKARQARPGSPARDYYVWSDTDQKYKGTRIIFTDTEVSNWTWDPVAKAYFWHRFFAHQPDLNFDNPKVVRAVVDVMRFWLDIGVDGLRLDAVPYLIEREGTNCENLPETHQILKSIRAELDARYSDRMLLAEANQWPEDVRAYFGDGDECHMAFHFPVMPRLYMAVAQEDRHPITDILRQTPEIPEPCQWAVFLRNHDELTLEMVTDRERDYMWRYYAADPRMRINVGIRRRLSPLMGGDRRKIELLNSLLMSMPGTPIVYYGDEIGMGDNIYLGDRDGVRTPMQWSPDRNGGFSKADPNRLYLPAIMDPVYGFQAVNVEAQSRSPSSLLNWMRRLIEVRQGPQVLRAFGRGKLSMLYPGNRKVLAYTRECEGQVVLCVANLSRSPQPVELDLHQFRGRYPIELFGKSTFPPVGAHPYLLTLPAYGFYWFLLATEGDVPRWHVDIPEQMPDLITLVLPHTWKSLVVDPPKRLLEQDILPGYLPKQRWYAGKGSAISKAELFAWGELGSADRRWLLTLFKTRGGQEDQSYFLPLSLLWEKAGEEVPVNIMPATLARVRTGARVGWVHDAFLEEPFVLELFHAMRKGTELETSHGRIRFTHTEALQGVALPEPLSVRRIGVEQSNTSVILGERMVLKGYRRLQAGVQPELEVSRYLTEVAKFRNTPPLLGAIEYFADGETLAMGMLQAFVENQGDGWAWTLAYLDRFLDERQMLPPNGQLETSSQHEVYLYMAHRLGVRTAELHQAFALPSGDPAFGPEPATADDLERWRTQVHEQADLALEALERNLETLPEDMKGHAGHLLARRRELGSRIDALVPDASSAPSVVKTRLHGDYHLGQVLVAENDFYIIDFEGEPARPLEARRARHSPLKDVAGMLRSFNYAGWSALLKVTANRPDGLQAVSHFAVEWERQAARAFLEGYTKTLAGSPLWPADEALTRRLLDLFTLEKALYELRYELSNRPGWVRIPLQGVMRLLEGATGGAPRQG